jgi:hypothetical protein
MAAATSRVSDTVRLHVGRSDAPLTCQLRSRLAVHARCWYQGRRYTCRCFHRAGTAGPEAAQSTRSAPRRHYLLTPASGRTRRGPTVREHAPPTPGRRPRATGGAPDRVERRYIRSPRNALSSPDVVTGWLASVRRSRRPARPWLPLLCARRESRCAKATCIPGWRPRDGTVDGILAGSFVQARRPRR